MANALDIITNALTSVYTLKEDAITQIIIRSQDIPESIAHLITPSEYEAPLNPHLGEPAHDLRIPLRPVFEVSRQDEPERKQDWIKTFKYVRDKIDPRILEDKNLVDFLQKNLFNHMILGNFIASISQLAAGQSQPEDFKKLFEIYSLAQEKRQAHQKQLEDNIKQYFPGNAELLTLSEFQAKPTLKIDRTKSFEFVLSDFGSQEIIGKVNLVYPCSADRLVNILSEPCFAREAVCSTELIDRKCTTPEIFNLFESVLNYIEENTHRLYEISPGVEEYVISKPDELNRMLPELIGTFRTRLGNHFVPGVLDYVRSSIEKEDFEKKFEDILVLSLKVNYET